MFMPGNSLKGLVTTFGENEFNKGLFPYDTLDITIDSNENRLHKIQAKLNEILCNKDIYSKYDFDNTLTNSGISVRDYVTYLEDFKNYSSK
jgi:hypothetical protein